VIVRDKVRDFAPLSRYGPSTSASVGRCPRTHQQLCTGSDGADGAQSVRGNAGDRTSGTGGGGVARRSPVVGRGWPGGGHLPPERKTRVRRTGEAADGHTPVRAGASAVVSAHRSSRGGGAHSALQSRLGPDHHYVKLLKRCKKILVFTPRTASGELSYFLAYSRVFSRNGIAPYRELRFLAHRDNVKRVHGMHRVYGSRQQSYFLTVFIYEHKYNTSVVDLVNSLIS
jgi:hypothetical protein